MSLQLRVAEFAVVWWGWGGFGGESLSRPSWTGKRVRIEECANEGSRFPSWLEPSRTINCLPKISGPALGRQATIPAAPPLLLMNVLVQRRAHTYSTNQGSCFCAQSVWGVEELDVGLWVVGNLLPVLEPLVLGLGESLFLHAAQLSWLPKRHRFRDTAFWHHWLNCSDTKHMIRVTTVSLHLGWILSAEGIKTALLFDVMLLGLSLTLMLMTNNVTLNDLLWFNGQTALTGADAISGLCQKTPSKHVVLAFFRLSFRTDAVSEPSSYSPEHAFAAGPVRS